MNVTREHLAANKLVRILLGTTVAAVLMDSNWRQMVANASVKNVF